MLNNDYESKGFQTTDKIKVSFEGKEIEKEIKIALDDFLFENPNFRK
jgi:hypothetical protein